MDLSVMNGTSMSMTGGTCDRGGTDGGGEFFLLVIGRPSRGEAARIDSEFEELAGGAVYAPVTAVVTASWSSTTAGVGGLARSPIAIRFNSDATGAPPS